VGQVSRHVDRVSIEGEKGMSRSGLMVGSLSTRACRGEGHEKT